MRSPWLPPAFTPYTTNTPAPSPPSRALAAETLTLERGTKAKG